MAANDQQVEAIKKDLVERVMTRINSLSAGGFVIPEGYLVENEIRQAYFILTQPRNGEGDYGKPIIQVTTEESVANALFNMAAAGLSATRNQCYFIPYGNVCTMQRSYFGSEAIAKRVACVTDVSAFTIHDGDSFSHRVERGKIVDVSHAQDWKNLDNPIIGAYCFVTFQDGKTTVDLMTMKQIQKSWNMSRAKGEKNKLQTQFDVEAAKRTVIQRALKPIINASQDATIWEKDFSNDDDENDVVESTHEVVNDRPALEAKTIQLPPATEKVTVPVESAKAEKVPAKKQTEPVAGQQSEPEQKQTQAPVTDFP